LGLTVSGVSTPMSRTFSFLPSIINTTVSPSTTRSTVTVAVEEDTEVAALPEELHAPAMNIIVKSAQERTNVKGLFVTPALD